MRLYSVLAPALVVNVICWWVYLAQDDLGFPWPAFVTLGSIGALVAQIQRRQARATVTSGAGVATGRNRNRNRQR